MPRASVLVIFLGACAPAPPALPFAATAAPTSEPTGLVAELSREQRCDAGEATVCQALANDATGGVGIGAADEAAAAWYRKVCVKGAKARCAKLAEQAREVALFGSSEASDRRRFLWQLAADLSLASCELGRWRRLPGGGRHPRRR
jgi:hypothetical protein